MRLRDYQEAAWDAILRDLTEGDGNPCAVLPTGGGKTPLLAHMCRVVWRMWQGRVIVLSHVKELAAQAEEKLRAVDPGLPVGIYCAGLGRKEIGRPVTVASIQSAHRVADALGPMDLAIVDEAHLLPAAGWGMYRRLLADLKELAPHLRIVGLTATPFRLDSGSICGPDKLLTHVCHETSVLELVERGFLARPVSVHAKASADMKGVRKVRGELDEREVAARMRGVLGKSVAEVVARTGGRKSVLVFCAGVELAAQTAALIRAATGDDVAEVYGDTPDAARDATIRDFKAGRIRWLVNVNVLTTGFDAPNVDCIVLLRATLSAGLYYQIVGRGFRTAPGKADFLVLDFGTNILRHGPVDAIRAKDRKERPGAEAPHKACPDCGTVTAANARECPACGFAFPPPKPAHEAKPDEETPILSATTSATPGHRVAEAVAAVAEWIVGGMIAPFRLEMLFAFLKGKFGVPFDYPGVVAGIESAGLATRQLHRQGTNNFPIFTPSKAGAEAFLAAPNFKATLRMTTEEGVAAAKAALVAKNLPPKLETVEVDSVEYAVHRKKGAADDAPATMRVTYWKGTIRNVSEWVCVEHDGFAAEKARAWWRKRTDAPMPRDAAAAVAFARAGGLAFAKSITVRPPAEKGQYERIVAHALGPKPDAAAVVLAAQGDACPF